MFCAFDECVLCHNEKCFYNIFYSLLERLLWKECRKVSQTGNRQVMSGVSVTNTKQQWRLTGPLGPASASLASSARDSDANIFQNLQTHLGWLLALRVRSAEINIVLFSCLSRRPGVLKFLLPVPHFHILPKAPPILVPILSALPHDSGWSKNIIPLLRCHFQNPPKHSNLWEKVYM